MRLFIAIQFTEPLALELQKAVRSLRKQAAFGTFTRPENLHLTLAFIGETQRVEAVEEVLQKVCRSHPSFPLTLRGAGHFSALYWAGLERSRQLTALASDLQAELRSAGFDIEERPFKPHITLGRRIVPRTAPRPAAAPGTAQEAPISLQLQPLTMETCWVSLMRSDRIDGVLTYTELSSYKLAGR